MKNICLSISTILFLLMQTVFVSATTYTFNNVSGNNWTTVANWLPFPPPNTIPVGDEVHIQGQCHLNTNITIEGTLSEATGGLFLLVKSGNTLTIAGGGIFNHGLNTLRIDGSLVIDAGGTLTQSGTVTRIYGTLTNNGLITVENGKTMEIKSGAHLTIDGNQSYLLVYGTLSNAGTVTLQNQGDLNVYSSGTLTVESGAYLFIKDSGSGLGVSGTLSNAGIVTLQNGGDLYVGSSGGLTVESGGDLTTFGNGSWLQVFGTLSNAGTVTLQNDGDLTVGSSGGLTVESGGDLIVKNNGSTLLASGTLSSSGTVTLQNGGDLNVNSSGTLTLESGGNLTTNGNGSLLKVIGTLNNAGTLTLQNQGDLTVESSGDLTVESGGFLTIEGGSSLVHGGTSAIMDGTLTNNGIVQVNLNKHLTINGIFNNTGLIKGKGIIDGTTGFTNPASGTVAPGINSPSPGCLYFDTDFNNSGTLDIELADGIECSDFDRIVVTGDAILNGTIDISFVNDVEPVNTSFTILTATGALGANPTIIWPEGYTGDWDICNTCVPKELEVTLNPPLPVELIDFRAALLSNNKVALLWQTASEENNLGFEIQRSFNSRDWEVIGFVDGTGTTANLVTYNFQDEFPKNGENYYRLKQIDFDGAFEYSEIRAVAIKESGLDISVYPNPTSEALHIDWSELSGSFSQNANGTIQLFSSQGKSLLTSELSGSDLSAVLQLNDYPKGMYSLVISIEQEVYSQQIILQ